MLAHSTNDQQRTLKIFPLIFIFTLLDVWWCQHLLTTWTEGTRTCSQRLHVDRGDGQENCSDNLSIHVIGLLEFLRSIACNLSLLFFNEWNLVGCGLDGKWSVRI